MEAFAQFLLSSDSKILFFINGLHAPWLDQLMWAVSSKWTWIPFYLLSIYLFYILYHKNWWRFCLTILMCIIIADNVASGIIKPLVQRKRPTHEIEIRDHLHLFMTKDGTYYYGGQYGFVSSHAANSCIIGILLLYFYKPFYKRKILLSLGFLAYVLLVSGSRVYLGVHYPSDLLGGWIVGIGICLLLILPNHKFHFFSYFCNLNNNLIIK